MEESSTIRLIENKERLTNEFNRTVSLTTIHEYLKNAMCTRKKCQYEPVTMNADHNKLARRDYVLSISNFINEGNTLSWGSSKEDFITYFIFLFYFAGKRIVYIDEPNFNLFCTFLHGRAKKGSRAKLVLPPYRGPNIHLIGAISSEGLSFYFYVLE